MVFLRSAFCFFALLAAADGLQSSPWSAQLSPAAMRLSLYDCTGWGHQRDMYGFELKGDAPFFGSLLARPRLLAGWGDGSLYSASIELGQQLGGECGLKVMPYLGFAYTYVATDLRFSNIDRAIHQKLHASTPYFGCELSYLFTRGWRVIGSIFYGWSAVTLRTAGLPHWSFNTSGVGGFLAVEAPVYRCWSATAALFYDDSLHGDGGGVIVRGVRAGALYRF